MRARLIQLSIRTRLTLIIFIVSAVTIVSVTALLVYWKANESREHAVELSVNITNILSQDAAQVLLIDSADAASDMALKLQSFKTITHAVLFDTDNTPLLAYRKHGEKSLVLPYMPANTVTSDNNYITTYVPLYFQSYDYGTASFRIRSEPFSEILIKTLGKVLIIIPLLILISYLLAIFLHKAFTRPLEHIAGIFKKYDESGDLVQIEDSYTTLEVNQLASSYNNMANAILNTKQELLSQKQRLHITLDSIADGVIATDINGKITYMNPSAEHICGWTENEATGKSLDTIYRLTDTENNELLISELDDTLSHGIVNYGLENMTLKVRKGELIDVQSTISPIRDANKAIIGAVVIFQNVTETRALHQQLRHQAIHDPLTGLLNRGEFENILQQRLQSLDNNTQDALLYLDLDQFKVVNDTSGHIAGDALLKQISSLLDHSVRESDIVARLGGDEFAILLPNCAVAQAQVIAEKIRKEISSFSFAWEDSHFRVGVSIGLVPITEPGITKTDVLTFADIACYAAKDMGRNRIHVYLTEDRELQHRRSEMQWITQISNALNENRLFLFAQKVIPLKNNINAEHIELLVRHIDNDGTLRTPGAFIPAIERYGMASKFDRWIISNALEDPKLIAYLKCSPKHCVNINLSGLTLGDTDLIDFVSSLLKNAQLPPRTVCFEITETAAVANLNATRKFIRSMKLLGCDFALDDFGSGVSSFAYLKSLPVDFIKIDGALVRDIDQNPVNEAMVNAINQIGQVMKMKTVAEFVESKNVQDKLESIGVDFAQGYHIHMPAPLHDVINEQAEQDTSNTVTH